MIPKLRFKEFTDEWQVKKLGDIFDVTRGYVLASSKTHPTKDQDFRYPVYSSQTKKDGLMGYYTDYLYEDAITWTTDGANAGEVRYRDGKFYCTNVCGVLKSDDGYANNTVSELLNRITHRYVSYVGNPKLMNGVMANISLLLPTVPEQQKIGKFLGGVDDKLASIQSGVTAMHKYKQGVMQALFSGKLRFKDENGNPYPDWEEKTLGDMFTISSSKRVYESDWKSSGIPFYRTREILSLINNKEINNPLYINKELYEQYTSKYGRIEKGDMLVTGVGTIGKMYLVQDDNKFYFKDGNVIWLKNNPKYSSTFVYYAFQTRLIKKQIDDNASITTVGTFTIEGAKKTKIILPCKEEQQKIADFLKCLDDKIKIEEEKLNQAKNFKKSLLQRMFV